jgi:hypothetical protein
MWHGVNDYVTWSVIVPKSGRYDVYLDWACANESAGNRYILEAGPATLNGDVAGTGGWSHYLRVRVGHLRLDEGLQVVKVRPAGPALKGALMDLRTVYLAPADHRLNLQEETIRQKPDYASLAQKLIGDKVPAQEKEAIINQHAAHAAELIAAMTAGLQDDAKEEYRRIPWIWRVAITAGKRNETETLRRLMTVAMPKEGEPLRDWQAVVIGGGVVNGLSQLDIWPGDRIKELVNEPDLASRWRQVIASSHVMADNEKVPTGTRYDALRIIALDDAAKAISGLKKYLPPGSNEELQMGAVSGLVDVKHSEATERLASSLSHLKRENLRLAIDGLLRTPERAALLLTQLEAGKLKPDSLDLNHRKKVSERMRHWPEPVRERMSKFTVAPDKR